MLKFGCDYYLRLGRIYPRQKIKLASGLLTLPADSAHFQSHYPDLKTTLLDHLLFQFLERRACVFHDRAAAEASHVAVIAVGLGFVIVLLALDVHKIQFVDQPAILKQREGSVDRGAIDVGIMFPRKFEKRGRVQMPGRVLNNIHQEAPLSGHAYVSR
jgi:hypothetical protein